jgi:RNA polymerase III transcription factor (TF)IIIC subunit HTH domain
MAPRRFKAFLLPGEIVSDPTAVYQKHVKKTENGYMLDLEHFQIQGITSQDPSYMVFENFELVGSVTELTVFYTLADYDFEPDDHSTHIWPYALSNQLHPQSIKAVESARKTTRSANDNWHTGFVWHFADKEIPKTPILDGKEKEQPIITRLIELFNERPIWQKSAIDEQLANDAVQIPCPPWKVVEAIRMVSFHAVDGPWRNTHIKFGYDPRDYPESRIWQSIDFRDPFLRDQIGRDEQQQQQPSEATAQLLDCHFRVPPVNRSQMYQLCDIEDSVVQAMLRALQPQSECSSKSGWFSESDLEKFRNQLKVRSELLRKV